MTTGSTRPGVRGLQTLRDTWRLFGLLMGPKRRRLLLQPVLGLGIAATETVSLLAVVRLLLLLSDGDDRARIALGPLDVELTVWGLTAVALAASVVSLVLRLADARLAAANLGLAIRTIRDEIIAAWFDADWERVKGDRFGRLQQLLGVNALQAVIPINLVVVGSTASISLVLYSVIIVVAAPLLAVLLVLIAAVTAASMAPLRRRVKRASAQHTALTRDLQLSATSYALLNRELHVFGAAGAAVEELADGNRQLADRFRRVRFLQRLTPGVYSQVMLSGIVVLVAISHALDVSATTFGVMAVLGVRALTYVQILNTLVQQHLEAQPFIDEIVDAIAEKRAMAVPRGDRELGPVERLELRDVGYEYSAGVPALRGVELRIGAGEWVGIVGPSGGGKTTLCNVIAGLLAPTNGEYRVNGHRPQDHTAASWARQFALLSQEPTLLRASIRENIAFHRPASTDEILAAAEAAGIRDLIESLPDGLDTAVGEGSSTLSGGQRQRLALARTILARPTCVILDEPTSALDAANEDRLRRSLATMAPETIVLVVSHRRALLEHCHRFVAISGGTIVADGPAGAFDLTPYVGAATHPDGAEMQTTSEGTS